MANTLSDLETQPLALKSQAEQLDTSRKLTNRQILYLAIFQGVGSAILDGGINFGIACAMYRGVHTEIRLWPLDKHTIAGDAGLTVIIQGMLTYVIAGCLVRRDVRAGIVEPFSFPFPDVIWWQSGGPIRRWVGKVFKFMVPEETLSLREGFQGFCKSFVLMCNRAFVFSATYFLIFWPLLIAIIAPLYGGVNMADTWIPQIIKAVFAGVLGLFMTPFVATLALGLQPQKPIKKKITSTTLIASPSSTREVMGASNDLHRHIRS